MSSFNHKEQLKVPESLLSHIWKGQWLKQVPFPASDGRVVRVKWAGRDNKDSGPDFLNATIVLDDEIVTGDIELHVKSSDWRSHGHHLNPHFNSVILQVVFWDDSKQNAQLENGDLIPTLPLREFLNGSMDDLAVKAESHQKPSLSCRSIGDKLGEESIGKILDQYGVERFYLKSATFEVDLIIEEPEQVLYQHMMGALGYTKNKNAFEELARRLPLRVIDSIVQEQQPINRTLMLQALLLGSAGLLPSQCDGKSRLSYSINVGNLEGTWNSLGISDSMSKADWHFFRMHPKNFPTSRLIATGYLLNRYLEGGLLRQVLELVRAANPGKDVTKIEKGFVVPGLIGQGRAREITVNVVLPFFYTWAEMNSQSELKEHVFELYGAYPRLGENQITRYLTEIFWDYMKPKRVKSAQRQQGMIHLYKTLCQDQRCDRCPINMEESPDQD